jgi:RNA polymerase sigma factor (sigma-70 family)
MSSLGSITKLIRRVKHGDAAASEKLVARYMRRLLGLARIQLRGKYVREADEEDVIQSVFLGFFLGAERGQYKQLQDRDDLWQLLVKITLHKVQKLIKQHEARKRHPARGPDATPSPSTDTLVGDSIMQWVADRHPPPDLEVLAKDAIERLLRRLGNAQLRSIAVWKWEGYTNDEIAARLGCKTRTIERKLRLIRTIWGKEDAS